MTLQFLLGIAASVIAVPVTWLVAKLIKTRHREAVLKTTLGAVQRQYLRRAASYYLLLPGFLSALFAVLCFSVITDVASPARAARQMAIPGWAAILIASAGGTWCLVLTIRWMSTAIEAELGLDLEHSLTMLAGITVKEEQRNLMRKKAQATDESSLREFCTLYHETAKKYGIKPVTLPEFLIDES